MGLVRFIAKRFNRLLNSPLILKNDRGDALSRQQIGQLGEEIAAAFLRSQGFKVLYRNFRAPHGGEVDIVCRDKDILVFIEVKTRTQRGHSRPIEAVTLSKQRLIARGATEWLRLLGHPEIYLRFDVVEVYLEEGSLPEINRVENVFSLPREQLY